MYTLTKAKTTVSFTRKMEQLIRYKFAEIFIFIHIHSVCKWKLIYVALCRVQIRDALNHTALDLWRLDYQSIPRHVGLFHLNLELLNIL